MRVSRCSTNGSSMEEDKPKGWRVEEPAAAGAAGAAHDDEGSGQGHLKVEQEPAPWTVGAHEPARAAASSRGGDMSGRISPRSARLSATQAAIAGRGHLKDRSAPEAFSPAFLSPRLWNEEDMLLPPSSEVPSRPVTSGRETQDRGCFGIEFPKVLYVVTLFIVNSRALTIENVFQGCTHLSWCSSCSRARRPSSAQTIRCPTSLLCVVRASSRHTSEKFHLLRPKRPLCVLGH